MKQWTSTGGYVTDQIRPYPHLLIRTLCSMCPLEVPVEDVRIEGYELSPQPDEQGRWQIVKVWGVAYER